MWREILIGLILVLFPAIVSAQNQNLEIQLVSEAKISLLPGSSHNLVIKLVNHSEEEKTIDLKMETPPGWKCFSNLNNIRIPGSKTSLKILSLNIPEGSLAGDYHLRLEASNSQQQAIGEITIPITIKPSYNLSINLVSAPEYVFASDTFSVQFMVQNRSNSKAEVEVLLKGTGDNEQFSFSLLPDSARFISRKVQVEKGILKSVKRNVSATASMVQQPEVQTSSHHAYTVIPSGDIKFDPYNRFPVEISTLFVTDNPQGKRVYALLTDITGQGFLDAENTKSLNFQFRGPDRRGKPLYGINDHYFMEYQSPKSSLMVGDQTYRLSYLTENSRYGRGAQAEHSFSDFTIGSFIAFPRFYPKTKREISVYTAYRPSPKLELQLGYLNKLSITEEVNHLATFNGTASPFTWAKLAWEYALGSVGVNYKQAVKTELRINYKPISLLYTYTLAEKGFPGYFNDTRYTLANGNIRLSKKTSLGVNYSLTHQNTALDTLFANAPFSKNLFLTFNYRLLKNGGLSVSYNFRNRQDRMEPRKFDYSENSARIILNQKIEKFGIDLLGEYGKTENLLLPVAERINNMYRGRLNLNYQTSKNINLSGFVSYQQNKRYLIDDRKNWIYGTSLNAPLSKKLSLFFNFQSSYNMEEYYRDRSILDGRLSYTPNAKNRIEISSRYNLIKNSLDVKELAFMLKYVRILNLPANKKKNIGKLSGRIINKGVKNIEGILISLGADRALTDKNGNYSFPLLPSGNYFMMIDYSKAGVNAIPEIPGPYPVEILPGEKTSFDIGLTLTSKIKGKLLVEKDAAADDKTFAGIKNQLGKLMIEAKNGNETFRIFTNDEGQFSFESLRPGQWTVKVYERGIPREYELMSDLFTLDLSPGVTGHIEVKIKEKRRRIKFQKIVSTTSLPAVQPSEPTVGAPEPADQAAKRTAAAAATGKTSGKPGTLDSTIIPEYRLQIAASKGKKLTPEWLKNTYKLDLLIQENDFSGYYIYTVGSFTSTGSAQRLANKLITENQIPGVFIVTFSNGKRIK